MNYSAKFSRSKLNGVGLGVDSKAVAYKFYGWLTALCGWLAGLSRLK